MKEMTINIAKDFGKILGGANPDISPNSGREFREEWLEKHLGHYDRIIIELDGTLGYPVDFLEETFGKVAARLGKKKFNGTFRFISRNTYATEKIDYLVAHCGKE